MKILKITTPSQLNILFNQKAQYRGLSFYFSKTYLSQLKKALSYPYSYQMIIRKNLDFAGYISAAETLWKKYLTIIELFISPNYQGRGIGEELTKKIIFYAKKEKLKGIIVQTEKENVPALKFYTKIGFKKFQNSEWKGISYKLDFKQKKDPC